MTKLLDESFIVALAVHTIVQNFYWIETVQDCLSTIKTTERVKLFSFGKEYSFDSYTFKSVDFLFYKTNEFPFRSGQNFAQIVCWVDYTFDVFNDNNTI